MSDRGRTIDREKGTMRGGRNRDMKRCVGSDGGRQTERDRGVSP